MKAAVAANLAVALDRAGARAGLCDCDMYGPSIGLMFGANDERPMATEEGVKFFIERFKEALKVGGYRG